MNFDGKSYTFGGGGGGSQKTGNYHNRSTGVISYGGLKYD